MLFFFRRLIFRDNYGFIFQVNLNGSKIVISVDVIFTANKRLYTRSIGFDPTIYSGTYHPGLGHFTHQLVLCGQPKYGPKTHPVYFLKFMKYPTASDCPDRSDKVNQ